MAQFAGGRSRLKSVFNGDGLCKVNAFGTPFSHSASNSIPLGNPKFRICILASSSSSTPPPPPPPSPSSTSCSVTSNNQLDRDFDDIEIDELAAFRGLVLDISYRPVNVVCWKRAICLEFMDKADVLEYYDQTVNSPSGSFYIPAVLRVPHLLQVVKRRTVKRGLSRKNILNRDNFMCQYCSSCENLTVDHVLPIARGGKWTWENLVTACAKCNSKKGQKTLEEVNMRLMKVPKAPKDYDILAIPLTSQAIKMLKMRKGMPEEWQQYLSNQ
ncbi:HNH endonuclease [Striga asiatica]|uniref:HNH endonuclease n=1 Tax=Striga asiatica TaxID=4170 RepID=A0A5A7QXX7_STRAF|nr:HNH endonuclease [Striga asiatica]